MTIQSSAQIGQMIRNAVAFGAQNWRGVPMNSDTLARSVQDFFELLDQRSVQYVLAGGVALLHYIEGRNTQDLDLLVAFSALKKLPELTLISLDKDFARAAFGDLQIDLLLTRNALFRRVQSGYSTTAQFLDRRVPIATVDGLLLLKLYALPSLYRQGNFIRVGLYENDIAALLYAYQPDVAALKAELSKYLTGGDLEEVSAILAEVQKRIERFKGQGKR